MWTPRWMRPDLVVGAVFRRGDGAFFVRVRRRGQDGIDQSLTVQRLGQEGLSPGSGTPFTDTGIIKGRNNNGGNLLVDAIEIPLQIESAEIRHMNVDDEALRNVTAHCVNKLPRRAIGRSLERRCVQQTSQRRAYGRLVVNNGNPCRSFWRHLPEFRANVQNRRVARRAYMRPPSAGPVCRDNSGLVCKADQIGHALYAEFRHHSPAMDFHRLFDSAETCGDLLVEPTGNDVPQYFPLSMCQCGET